MCVLVSVSVCVCVCGKEIYRLQCVNTFATLFHNQVIECATYSCMHMGVRD